MDGYPSGQRGQTVNLLAFAFEGSNPSPSTIFYSPSIKILPLPHCPRSCILHCPMSEQLQKLLDAGKVNKPQFEKLLLLQPGSYVTHKSWGFGQIKEYDFVTNQILIDFKGKPAHPMQIIYAADSLTHLPDTHILSKQQTDPEGLKALAKTDSAAFLSLILKSFTGHKAITAQIEPLFKDFYTPAEWKKVWSKLRTDLRKNTHFVIPSGKNDPIVLLDEPADVKTELLDQFTQAVGILPQLTAAQGILREIDYYKDSLDSIIIVLDTINVTIEKNVANNLLYCVELAIIRDDIKDHLKIQRDERLTTELLLIKAPDLGKLLNDLPGLRAKKLLTSIKGAHPDDWDTRLLKILNSLEGGLITDTFGLFLIDHKEDIFVKHIDKLIREHALTTPLILWIAKEKHDALVDLINVRLAQAIISTLEREQFLRDGRTGGKLHDLIMDHKTFFIELIESGNLEEIKDLVRNLQISPAFEELNKRSLLGRIVKAFPEVQSLINTGTGSNSDSLETKSSILHVSWKSLERRKLELDHIINKEIPANIKEIEVAKSYGDLRENHEFKAAKERQRILARRRAEIEQMLDLAQGIDFEKSDTSQVSIGTEVKIEDVLTGETTTYNILGAWDSDPEKGIISYLTPVGQSLLYKKPGETTDVLSAGVTRTVKIKAVSPFNGEF